MMDYPAPSSIAVARSRRFAFYNIGRIRPFLTKNETELLVHVLAISHLVYCNSLLDSWTAGLPASVTKLLQRIHNAAVPCFLPKFSHVTLLLCDLHWLPVADRIQFKTMVLNFKAAMELHPIYLRPHAPAWALRSTTLAGWLVPPLLRANKGHCSAASVVERTSNQCQDSRVICRLLPKDSSRAATITQVTQIIWLQKMVRAKSLPRGFV